MKISLCQVNLKNGNLKYNFQKIKNYFKKEQLHSDLVIFPELSLTGYLLKDLVKNPGFLNEVSSLLPKIAKLTKNSSCSILLGHPTSQNYKVFNSVSIFHTGKLIFTVNKHILPNYEVFNEPRNFSKSKAEPNTFNFKGEKIGILICEDAWHDNIPNILSSKGASMFLIVNASPFDLKKQDKRINIATKLVKKYKIPVVYLNSFGCYDELVFDGGSFAIDKNTKFLCEPYLWEEGAVRLNTSNNTPISNIKSISEEENIYQALVLSVRDYFKKNNFSKAVLGLSGGIDSALVANICADALGSDNLKSIILPSEFNSEESMKYALELVQNVGCEKLTIPIDKFFKNFVYSLENNLKVDGLLDITLQNLQARIRAVLLMAISNEENSLLVATSNKSESAVGYTTIYGDMCGGFAPIKDVYKTQVYKLAKWRNENIPTGSLCLKINIIPNFIIEREPSAELSHNQKDSDSLLPYDILDKILYDLIELDLTHKNVSKQNDVKLELVKSIAIMIKKSEYKRNQAPVGPKISIKSFNYDRIYPITRNV